MEQLEDVRAVGYYTSEVSSDLIHPIRAVDNAANDQLRRRGREEFDKDIQNRGRILHNKF